MQHHDTPERACELCGATFQPYSRGVPQRFCSAKCRDRFNGLRKRGQPANTPSRDVAPRPCASCGEAFTPRETGAEQRFCSKKCQQHDWFVATKVVPLRNCGICGVSFVPSDGHATYCSADCRRRANIRSVMADQRRHPERKHSADARWKRAHPEACSASAHRRNALKRQLPASLTPAEWRQTLSDFEGRCAYCGTGGRMTREHFIPVQAGGGYTASNMLPACPACNFRKRHTPPHVFCAPALYKKLRDYLSLRG